MKKGTKVKGRFFRGVLSVIVVLVSVFALVSSFFVNQSDRELFGYGAFTLQGKNSDSVLIMKDAVGAVLKTGDIVSVRSENGTVLREIGAPAESDGDEKYYTALDPSTGKGDDSVIYEDEIEKVCVTVLPYVGSAFGFIKTTPGFIVAVFVPVALLVLIRVCDAFAKVKALREEVAFAPQPVAEKPVAPVHDEPVAPVYDEPVAPVHDEPVVPMFDEPVVPMFDEPVAPVHDKPVAPVHDKPVAPVRDEPVAPVLSEPAPEPEKLEVTMEDMLEKLRKMREELEL